jgi:protein-L-isoaspartate(D-aspartate) O-methyltransferase
MPDFREARSRMVERQLAGRDIRDARVLEALRHVPRERFLPEHLAEFAYDDGPLPIASGQTISQPYIVALMAQAAALTPPDRVLEIGTGSGYAAAVFSHLADRVFTIERHAALANAACQRLADLGCANVEVRVGDGTLGWPDAAPFDAIVVAAGGPDVPDALRRQLKRGGRLVMPVGDRNGNQRLVRVTRRSDEAFAEEDLGGVLFVPLIGEQGWDEGGCATPARSRPAVRTPTTLPEMIAQAAEGLPDLEDPDFGAIADRFADARVVLLGEASHGTSEFYRARAAVTRRLVERHGFTIVAAEADWPDAASLDRFVRRRPDPVTNEGEPFQRFPTWMWRNTDVAAFTGWMRAYNDGVAPDRQVGFYGLDLYNLSASMRAVIDYLDKVDPEAARTARERYGCLQPWGASPQSYGRMANRKGLAPCENAVVAMLQDINARKMTYAAHDGDEFLDAAANARLVKDAESYYRTMYYGAAESWNVRDRHMYETLCQILEAKGAHSKAVVWAHNSHIGDARATDMGWRREELNIGQLCRERFGREAALIGFGTHAGTVAAADDWDAPMRIMRVNASLPESYERLAHESGQPRFLLDLRPGGSDRVREALSKPRLERFIGVIYRPDTERLSHYASCDLAGQFDAWIWFDETSAVTPLGDRRQHGPDDTYPFGL